MLMSQNHLIIFIMFEITFILIFNLIILDIFNIYIILYLIKCLI